MQNNSSGGKVMKTYIFVLVIAFLLGITVFSVYKYFDAVTQRETTINILDKLRVEAVQLENQNENLLESLGKEKEHTNQLSQENLQLSEDLKSKAEKLNQLDAQLQDTLRQIDGLSAQIFSLQNQREILTLQLAQVSDEKEQMKARLNSIPELKKAIRELKKQTHKTSRAVTKHVVMEKKEKPAFITGNRGFIIKNGRPTSLPKIRIEVEPVLK
jgi:chromosome segregation ATPase